MLIAGNGDTIFRRLMRCIGRDDLAIDPNLQVNAGRVKRVAEIDDAIEWTRRRNVDAVLAAMDSAKVPAGRVYTIAASQAIRSTRRARCPRQPTYDGADVAVPGIVPKLAPTPGRLRGRAPRLGEHTVPVLAALGISADALRTRGVIE